MKGIFDAYVLWPLAKKFQNWIVEVRFTSFFSSGFITAIVKVSKSRKRIYVVIDSPKKRTLGHFYVLKNAPAFVFLENLGQHIFFRNLLTFNCLNIYIGGHSVAAYRSQFWLVCIKISRSIGSYIRELLSTTWFKIQAMVFFFHILTSLNEHKS